VFGLTLSELKKRLLIIVMILLTAFVLHSAARIELLNIRAGNYLPRSDRNLDASFSDGKWRISEENTPRDQLRTAVETFGLMQYVLAPLLLILALTVFLMSARSWTRMAATFSVVVATVAISLALYREYHQSLGW
jgi:hypothetical protein